MSLNQVLEDFGDSRNSLALQSLSKFCELSFKYEKHLLGMN